LPNHKSAEKRVRTSKKENTVNRAIRSEIRTSLKKVRNAATKAEAEKEMPNFFSLLDKAARRSQGGIRENTAGNYKRKAFAAAAAKA
jgi:small subunit ribosomal protein S20